MENVNVVRKQSVAKSSVIYGVIFGAILILEFVASYALNLNSVDNKAAGIIMGVANFLVLPFIFIMLACNNYKKINHGYITFGQSITAGISVSAIAGLVSSVATSLIYLIMPEAKQQVLEQTRKSLASQPGMTSEGLQAAMKGTELFMEPYLSIPVSILAYCFVGLLLSLVIGAIVKKENPYGPFSSEEEMNKMGAE